MNKPEPFVWIVIPLVPPSVNMYVRHTRTGRHYVTKEAQTFKDAVFAYSARRKVRADAYEVEVFVYLGKGDRGDADNFWKVILDALVAAGTIDTDAKASDITLRKRRDWESPRTEIRVRAIAKEKTHGRSNKRDREETVQGSREVHAQVR